MVYGKKFERIMHFFFKVMWFCDPVDQDTNCAKICLSCRCESVSNETLQLGGWGLVHRWDTNLSTIMCFWTVYESTVGNVTSMRNFGGIPEKFRAFGISHDALLGSYYV